MIITKTPFRMSFFGGGTDMPEYFNKNKGAVLSTTIDKYCYVNVRHLPPFFDYKTEISYSKLERVKNIEEIEHPAVRNAMKMCGVDNIRLAYEADLPARSGLGTSSSFAAGMILAFNTLQGKSISKKDLSDASIKLERQLCQEAGGWQDQIAASYGGFNRIDFGNNDYTVRPVSISLERKRELNDNLLMFFTGFTRFSSEVQKQNNSSSGADKEYILSQMYSMVDEAEAILTDKNKSLDDFGSLLNSSWELKRRTGKGVSNDAIDALYDRGIKAGALGGKLLGAGGGGFLVFYVKPENRSNLLKEMAELLNVPFRFSDDGASVIYCTPEDYKVEDR